MQSRHGGHVPTFVQSMSRESAQRAILLDADDGRHY